VSLDDALRDRETEPCAAAAGRAAIKLLEHLVFVAARQAGTVVGDLDRDRLVGRRGEDADRAGARRVLDRVVQQIDQHLLDQHVVNRHQRQILWNLRVHAPIGELLAEAAQRRADDLFERMPFLAQLQGAGLEPRHLQKVLDQTVEPVGLFAHRFQEALACRRVELRAVVQHGGGGALDRGQRRSQIVRDRAEQRVAEALGLHAHLGLLRLVGQMRPLDGQRGLVRECLQLVKLVRRVERVSVGGPDPENAYGSARRLQRQIERGGARQGGSAEARGLMVLMDPLGHAELVRVELELAAAPGLQGLAAAAGQEHHDLAAKHVADVPGRDRKELVEAARARELSAHRVERRRPLLALARGVGLHPDPRREAARHQADHQHHEEHEQVPEVGDRERERGRDEEEVQRGDAQDRGHQRRAAAVASGDHDDPEQIDHDQIRELEER
jgi:hypothetical protein